MCAKLFAQTCIALAFGLAPDLLHLGTNNTRGLVSRNGHQGLPTQKYHEATAQTSPRLPHRTIHNYH
jgi:hypothetical protein